MTKTPKNIIDEQGRLETDRQDYESLKQLSTALAYPGRSDQMDYGSAFLDNNKGKSNILSRKVYDATAFRGFEIWKNGIVGNWMPKETNWFTEQMSDRKLRDSKQTNKWLQELDEHFRYVLASSRDYYASKLWTIGDSGCIGDSFMYIDKDKTDGKIMTNVPHPRECWVKYDWWGRVLHIHHKFSQSMEEIVAEFGLQALSLVQQQKFKEDSGPDQKVIVIHGVYRNKDYNPDGIGIKDMLWQHYYVNASAEDNGKMMRQTGSYTLNPIPWSLNRPSHEGYGRGIVSQMLIEILTCNFMSKDMLLASQVAARPPMLITSALKHKLDLGAGGVNFVSSRETQGLKMGDLIARLIDSSGYPFGADQHSKWQAMVNDRFGVSLFLALTMSQNTRTLGEARMIKGEQSIMLAPFMGTLGATTDMEFDRIYSLEAQDKSSGCPEPPQEVLDATNGRIDVQYIGPLFQLLKQYYETGNLLTTIANIREVLSVSPDAAFVVEGDELMRRILKTNNTPEDIIRDPDAVAELRAIAAQQEEQKMQAELAIKAASAVPNLSKKIESDSVLSKLAEQAA